MVRKLVTLPVVTSVVDDALAVHRGPPTVDEARRRLGGRATSTRPVGGFAEVLGRDGTPEPAVVIFATEQETWLWVGEGVVRRARTHGAPVSADRMPHELEAVSADARVFASLVESQTVRYQLPDGSMQNGVLVEKCRFGALVSTSSGKTMAISFRLLWPSSNADSS